MGKFPHVRHSPNAVCPFYLMIFLLHLFRRDIFIDIFRIFDQFIDIGIGIEGKDKHHEPRNARRDLKLVRRVAQMIEKIAIKFIFPLLMKTQNRVPIGNVFAWNNRF